jgi:hypothetical protein
LNDEAVVPLIFIFDAKVTLVPAGLKDGYSESKPAVVFVVNAVFVPVTPICQILYAPEAVPFHPPAVAVFDQKTICAGNFTKTFTTALDEPPVFVAVTVYAVDAEVIVGVPEIVQVVVLNARPVLVAILGLIEQEVIAPPVFVGAKLVIAVFA